MYVVQSVIYIALKYRHFLPNCDQTTSELLTPPIIRTHGFFLEVIYFRIIFVCLYNIRELKLKRWHTKESLFRQNTMH